MSFDENTALTPDGDGAYRGQLHDGWWTPRGPLGGYVMAIILRGLMLAVGDEERRPRSLTVHFLRAPSPGEVVVRAAVERAGRSLTTASARLEQEGELMAIALAALSKPWPGPLLSEAPMPEVKPSGDRDRRPRGLPGAERSPFTDLVVMHGRFGAPPFSGADHAEAGGWLGLFERRQIDALSVAVLADAWYPAPWPRLSALAPAPTIDLTVHFRAPLPLPDSMLLGRFKTSLVREGFFEEDGELWAPDGTLVAQSRQLGLLIGAQA